MKYVMHATYGETLAFMIRKRSQIATSLYQIAQSFHKVFDIIIIIVIVVSCCDSFLSITNNVYV